MRYVWIVIFYVLQLNLVWGQTPVNQEVIEKKSIESQQVQHIAGIKVGEVLPSFAYPALDGESISLQKMLDTHSIVVVSYFASWCGGCQYGIAQLETMVKMHPQMGVIYISLGDRNLSQLQKFVQQNQMSQPVIWDKFQAIAKRHGLLGQQDAVQLPITLLLNQEGVVLSIILDEGEDFSSIVEGYLPKP